MTELSRRTFLSAAAAAGALPILPGVAGTAAAAGAPAPELFGPAAVTAAVVGMAVEGDTGYIVTRGQTPPKIVTVDLASRTVTRIDRLDRGDGGWACTISGGQVYVGTYPTPDLYRYDPATGEVELLGTIGPSGGFVWCLTTAPDGTVYAGTSPRCELWEYRPDTGVLRNLGRVATDTQFARVVAADDTTVYVGTTPLRHVIAVDRATGAKRDIYPAELERAGSVDPIIATGGRVLVSAGGQVLDLAPDGSDYKVIAPPEPSTMIDALTLTPSGELLGAARRTGALYRRVGDALEQVGTVNVGDETRGISLRDGSVLLGGGGSGTLWFHDLATGDTETFDLTEQAGVAGPDLVQSIAYDGSAAYVGGHFYLTVHRPWAGAEPRRIRVAGEVKAMQPHQGRVLAALYPSGELISVDPATDTVTSLGLLGNDQQRPWELALDAERGLLLVASAPGTGRLNGALTVLDLETGAMDAYVGVLPDQGVMSVTLHDGIAYLAGDTWGGGGATPTQPAAQVAAFDLETRTVLWRAEPIAGQASLQHVEVHDGFLYGVYKRVSGTWFALDLATGTVVRQGKLSGYGEIVVHNDQVFAATNFGDYLYRLRPDHDAEQLAGPLVASWFTVPQLEFERGWKAWGVAGRQLARFDLHPRHRR
ncbi:PQQ-binding-like beta-propeller repeat protein [Jiangella muralis]|uniref:PQQ-binding-like beta-propeller repeat protein n=1 Tax=Jiangella muralis TaxID=702383 RepID=UPI00069E2BA0|nr:PQQ-binding-like beta-propeller repeat protein [Jiangella muralis]